MDDETREINERMVTCLTAGDIDGFFQLAVKELQPRIVGDLIKNMRLSREDAEDCVFDVFKKVYVRYDDGNVLSLLSPIDYLWQASKNQALTLIRRRKSETDAKSKAEYLVGNGLTGFRHPARPLSTQDSARDTESLQAVQPVIHTDRTALLDVRSAVFLAESLLDDGEMEPEPSRLVEVVALAMSKLTPLLAEVIEYQLKNGFDVKVADAARELGIKHEATFRKRKERAYARLRVEIVNALGELGVKLRLRVEEAVEKLPDEFPSLDEVEEA